MTAEPIQNGPVLKGPMALPPVLLLAAFPADAHLFIFLLLFYDYFLNENSLLFSMRCVCFFPGLQGNGDWTVTYSSSNVCALRGAMVDINCTYEYPDNVQYRPNTVRTLWLTKGDTYQPVDLEHDTDYRVHVESSCGEVRCTRSRCHGTCTLRIKDLRQSDSAVYKFSFATNQTGGEYTGDPGVTLSVTGTIRLPMSTVCVWVCYCLSVCFYCLCVCGCAGSIKFMLFVILII